MTSVEEALELTRATAGLRAATRTRTLRAVPDSLVAPRVSSTLQQRHQWERRYRIRLRITDAGAITAAIGLTSLVGAMRGPITFGTVLHSATIGVVWFAILSALHTRDAALFRDSASEYRGVAHATGLTFGILAIIEVFADWHGMRLLLLVALPVGLSSLIVSRWVWRRWLGGQRKQGFFASRTLVVGDREDVEHVISTLHPTGNSGHVVVGATLLDEEQLQLTVAGVAFPVFGHVGTIADAARELGADTIIVASRPQGDPDFIKRLSWQLEGTAAELVLSSRLTDVAGPRLSFVPIDGLPLIRVQIPTFEGGRHELKRALDIVVAGLAVIVIALLAPALALLIKIDSRGPVFFFQERVGRDGRVFRMVKFRSMRIDAEQQLAALRTQSDGSGPLFKMKDDPRITRVGRVLRRLSIDELPQFWNVLTGDMSVVGPRPPLPSEVTGYDGAVSRRLYIKPGITGLWQVSGRSDLSWGESVRLDLRYVENWSVMNDLQIMWRTARVMLQQKGAY